MSSQDDSKWLIRDAPRKAKKARGPGRMLRMPLGLQRYVNKRGTMDGVYEFTRVVNGRLDITNAGISVGAARYVAATFVFTPQNIQLVSGVAGNTNTYNIPNAAEFAALFDKMKIDKVEMVFHNAQSAGSGLSGAQPNYLVFATDDNDTAASVDSIKQMDCKVWQPGFNATSQKIICKPKYQRLVYYTSLLSSYEPTSGYVVSDTAIPHYGIKVGVDIINDIAYFVNWTAKIHFKCKEVK